MLKRWREGQPSNAVCDVLRRPAAAPLLLAKSATTYYVTDLGMLVQGGGNAKAANRRLRNVLKAQSVAPRVIFTDRLVSYAAAREAAM